MKKELIKHPELKGEGLKNKITVKQWLDSLDDNPRDFNEQETNELLYELNAESNFIATSKYHGDGEYTLTIRR